MASGLAIALLGLLGPGQGRGSTYRLADHPGPSVSRETVRPRAADGQADAPASGRLTSLAARTLEGVGFAAPPIWVASAVSVTIVAPPDNALNAPVSTNVTVTFSEEIDPTTVTTGSFRLLDLDLLPVPAQVSVGPAALHATLDPDAALDFSQVYTVQLTDAVQNPVGGTLLPFASQFETGAEPPQQNLPDVSEEAVPPPNATQAKIGSAVSCVDDLNGDGLADVLTGAPGLAVGAEVEAGAAVVYFGSASAAELVQPDIIFEGVSAHDRTGVAVAGSFDFNGDGIPDILIGAEQVNRSGADDPVAGCADGAPCGNGKVYLIYFDPFDLTHYPNIGNPLVADTVDLSLVGGAIPGVVFTGAAPGDQAGFAVAGGGRVNAGIGQDLLIGAPGNDPGTPPRIDAGAAYVIFDDPSLSGTIALDRVANGQPDEISGVIYQGGAPGDQLGFSVSFPGDVTGTIDDDLAIGAPGADTTAGPLPLAPDDLIPDARSVVIPMGGGLVNGIIESTDIGVGTPGTQAQGEQAGMQLGYSVAGGGDTLVDGEQDLLMGAPTYDVQVQGGQPVIDAGLVAHTASKLAQGVIGVSQIGADPINDPNAVSGTLYTGSNAFDQLGTDAAGLGDVTGDGFDDIALGAPSADPLVNSPPFAGGTPVTDAGVVYQVDGLVPFDLNQGIIESSDIGGGVAGRQLTDLQQDENAGAALSTTCDVNGDFDLDFLVGAPGRDIAVANDDAGTVYVVVESAPELPGTCGPEGCVVADLQTGAQVSVPAGSITAGQIGLAVRGVLDVAELPVPPPAGRTLLGAADFDPEGQSFGAPLPTIHVPIRPALGGQFAGGEPLDLAFFLGGAWVPAGVTGTVQANPHYPNLKAVGANIDTLHYYAAFIDDADGDQYWDALDSDPLNPLVCADTDADGCDDCSSGAWDPSNNGLDTDGDGLCNAGDPDDDNDGADDASDCAPLDGQLWAVPGEVEALTMQHEHGTGETLVSWTAPAQTGSSLPLLYDTVRSSDPSDFVAAAQCLESDGSDTQATDTTPIPPGAVAFFLARAENPCGLGSAGEGPFGEPRTVISCP